VSSARFDSVHTEKYYGGRVQPRSNPGVSPERDPGRG
jgi:hypothetical protein